jgi:hypothetical protein
MIAPFGPGNNYCNPMEGGFNTGLRFRVFNSGTVNTPETTLETSGLNCPFVNSYPVPALTPKTDTYINVPNCKKVSEGRYTFKVWVNRGFRDFKEKVNGQPNVQSVTCQIIF